MGLCGRWESLENPRPPVPTTTPSTPGLILGLFPGWPVSLEGEKKSQAYYANALALQITENYGQLKVMHKQTSKSHLMTAPSSSASLRRALGLAPARR